MEGWISLHRKILNWEWYSDANTFRLFIHLLLQANHEDKKWKGQTINKGQLITSLEHLSNQLNLSKQQIRTSINKLKSTHEITVKSTNKFTLITIEKYSEYQNIQKENNTLNNTQSNIEITNKQQTNNKQITTNNNDNNDNNDNNNIYLYLLNKYKVENRRSFSEYMKKTKSLREDEKWNLLTKAEQTRLMSEI